MSIVEVFNNTFTTKKDFNGADLILVDYDGSILVGISKDNATVVAIKSENPRQGMVARRTALISVECNMYLSYKVGSTVKSDVFHIIKCYSTDGEEVNLFLETALLLIAEGDSTKESIINTFQTLASFFENKHEPSDNELNGLYAELFAIKEFHDELKLGDYWQSKDRLKFDFSITDKVKVEVKSTVKSSRTHHFKHDQLDSDLYKIFILSFMLRHDDNGLSLLELINICKPLLEGDSNKVIRLNRVLKNVDRNRLANISFEEDLTRRNMHIIRGENVPKFSESKPEGVANAEYDCDLEGVDSISSKEFTEEIIAAIGPNKG